MPTENADKWALDKNTAGQIGTEKGFFDWIREHVIPEVPFVWGTITGNINDQTDLQVVLNSVELDLSTHISSILNPHAVTKVQVGLSNVDNTSDVDKPVSTAQAAEDALNLKIVSNLSDLNNVSTARANLGMGKASGTLTRATSDVSGTQSVVLTFQPLFVLFSAVDNADTHILSDGWDDGTMATSTWANSVTLLATLLTSITKDHTNSIHIETTGGAGHTALITNTTSTGFTLTWTRLGAGRNITIKYLAYN
jgi:hypothetical protein